MRTCGLLGAVDASPSAGLGTSISNYMKGKKVQVVYRHHYAEDEGIIGKSRELSQCGNSICVHFLRYTSMQMQM